MLLGFAAAAGEREREGDKIWPWPWMKLSQEKEEEEEGLLGPRAADGLHGGIKCRPLQPSLWLDCPNTYTTTRRGEICSMDDRGSMEGNFGGEMFFPKGNGSDNLPLSLVAGGKASNAAATVSRRE